MLNANGSILADNRSAASQWAQKSLGLPEVQLQVRLRGNHLHILCEAALCPSQELVTARFTNAIAQTDLTKLQSRDRPPIYQLFLCGRKLGSRQNDWTVRLDCSSQGQNSATVSQTPPQTIPPDEPPTDAPKGGFFGKFINQNRKLKEDLHNINTDGNNHRTTDGGNHGGIAPTKPYVQSVGVNSVKETSNLVEHPTSTPQVRLELEFDAETVPIASRIEYPEVFETSPVTIDTSASSTFTHPVAVHGSETTKQQRVSHGTATLVQSEQVDSRDSAKVGTLTVSAETLAKRGHPDAIASYLSEILGPMGVSVKVSIREKELKNSPETLDSKAPENLKTVERRLMVLCESAYSPDPSLLASPIAGRLRKLKLENFRDAVIVSQVSGEAKPDWLLRVDLTAADKILKAWARWGDVPAIAQLLNLHLASSKVEVRATLKESTLHLFCSKVSSKGQKQKGQEYPDKQETADAIAPMLASLAPQGIHAATLYGVKAVSNSKAELDSPVWVDWLDLPAAHHPDLAAHPRTLAAEGDRSALTFLLNRLLNPNLKRKLETGGIRAVILQKDDVLHIMTESMTCPSQSHVAGPVTKFLRQLHIPGVSGVRVYGRRAGEKIPLWRCGLDVTMAVNQASGPTVAPMESPAILGQESVPEFAPSATDGNFSGLGENLVFNEEAIASGWRRGFKIGSWRTGETPIPQFEGAQLVTALVQPLVASGLFVPNEGLSTSVAGASSVRADRAAGIALVWAIAGCVLTFNTDWLLGRLVPSATVSQAPSASQVCIGQNCQNPLVKPESDLKTALPSPESPMIPESQEVNSPQIPSQPIANGDKAFNGSGFTKPGDITVPVAEAPAAIVYPTLRSEQLDDQIARYQEYIRINKKPPDILIVGSSRALRGIDPAVLETTLASGGYPGLKAYNFGVNGATLQVVDSIVRRILPPQQLPKLLVLADGARALNSGRPDLTFDAIASSEGYRQLARGSFLIRTNELETKASNPATNNPVAAITALVDNFLQSQANVQQLVSQKLVESSATYKKRDRVKEFLRSRINPSAPTLITNNQTDTASNQTAEAQKTNVEPKEIGNFEPNGFLPIDIRFNPKTYFQKHPKVSGYYDSDYQDFKLIGEQTVALKNLTEFTKVRNIDLVFVNMPLTVDYLDPVRTAYEQEFKQHMQQLAAQTGLIFRDHSLLWPKARESFSDPSHLNRYGAIEVSKQLAQDPMIPWPVKK
ncbi:hypothetical protein [Tychonema sp. BBK16]|uniref:hypothetical protein n=1 Tax=Tychonema sp. BBK16 TaxID=2699888 RepID=UPI001F41C492|nr:hypothetical protein [Tychonema sp. BBK16]MCF6375600.1 hypothetical protein [Tychonema sp. BBK16]